MKRILGLTTAALLGTSLLAAPAMAIDLNAGASAETGVSGAVDTGESGGDPRIEAQAGTDSELDAGTDSTLPDIDTSTTAAVDTTFDSALTAIDGTATTTQSISTMTEVQNVRVVSVSDLEGHDAAAVEGAVSQNQDGIDELRAAIEANAALSQELDAQGVDSSAVLAARVEADGAVTVFVM